MCRLHVGLSTPVALSRTLDLENFALAYTVDRQNCYQLSSARWTLQACRFVVDSWPFSARLVQWCIAKNGGGYTQRGVAKGLKVPCLFMITEVSIRCPKKPGGWYTAYTRVNPPPNTPLVLCVLVDILSRLWNQLAAFLHHLVV